MTPELHQDAPVLLLFGQDKALVDTRRWVLEKAGFRVCTAMSIAELGRVAEERTVELFVLCDSLEAETRASVLDLIHFRWPGARRLVLMPYSFSNWFEPAEEVFIALEGPEKLITAIRTLMVRTPLSASAFCGLPA